MKLLRICLLVLSAFAIMQEGDAQTFSKLYIEGRPSMLFGSIKSINGQLYVTGVTTTVRGPHYEKALFGKLNGNGDVEFINSIVDSDDYSYDIFFNPLKVTSSGNLIATGYKTDSLQQAFLMEEDTNGKILLWHEYTEAGNLIYQGLDVVELPDSGYLLAINIARSDNVSDVLIIRTDTAGNVLSKRDYYNGQRAYPSIIKSMYNGHYMIGAWSDDPTVSTPYWAKTWLIEIDRMGNMVRDWTDTSRKNLYPNGMEQTSDSGWIIVRQHLAYDISNFQAFNGSILKLDKNFNKQWEIDTGGIAQDAGMFDVKILSDGSYICVGANSFDTVPPGSAHDYGWLMKVSVTGQILWERYYLPDGNFEANDYLNSISLMPDGGFIACGRTESNINGQEGWIIRTDSNGCLLDNCGMLTTEIKEVSSTELSTEIFPNPSKNNFTVKLSLPPAHDIYLNVYDVTGRLSLHQLLTQQTTTIPHQLSAGVYLWRVQNGNGAVGGGKLVIE